MRLVILKNICFLEYTTSFFNHRPATLFYPMIDGKDAMNKQKQFYTVAYRMRA